MEEAILITHVRGIYCRQCVEFILGELLQTRGVLDAELAYLPARLTVRYDPAIVREPALKALLDTIGYPSAAKGAPGTNPILNALRAPFQKNKRF